VAKGSLLRKTSPDARRLSAVNKFHKDISLADVASGQRPQVGTAATLSAVFSVERIGGSRVCTANPKTLRAEDRKLRGSERTLHNALRLLFELLEEYSPPWYEKHHHDQAKVALKKPEVCYRSSLPIRDLLGTRADAGGIHLLRKDKNVQMPARAKQ
jgi:hypothetical protein